jgi:lipopolysaccharide/colanic/teichoic acid biosynthesis glycosyltransferase
MSEGSQKPPRPVLGAGKRAFDVSISILALILLAPIMLATTVMVSAKLGSPVLFRQLRPGLRTQPFEMLKFRTMRDAVDASGTPLCDSERLTSFGLRLRSSSLDELPGIWNVLKGEMSLVGPRPLLMDYVPLYSTEQARRHEVKPGLTGWAQVNGRNAIGWDEKFKLDVWYVDNWSFWLDVKILLLTIRKVLRSENIASATSATMERFMGSSPNAVVPPIAENGSGVSNRDSSKSNSE